MKTITINKPFDFHTHLRTGIILKQALSDHLRHFAGILAMPNLVPPITTVQMANEYHQNLPANVWTTLYLTEQTTIEDLKAIKLSTHIKAVKLYPKGATTNSASGVADIKNIYHLLQVLEEEQIPLLMHGEVTDKSIDIFDREAVFIEQILKPLLNDFPNIKGVMEHITTQNAVDFIGSTQANIKATITPQHLLLNRNDMLVGGIKPHLYCLPILKAQKHQQALIKAATSGSDKFFLGTDSAPHFKHLKESDCGCAGCYTALHAIELYATAFNQAGKLDKLNDFASTFGTAFYGLPLSGDTITLQADKWQPPVELDLSAFVEKLDANFTEKLVPLQVELDFKVI